MACPACGLQFDATGREVGSRFRCPCGEAVSVPEPKPHDAAVVRCSACGGPREGLAPACGFCGSDFTLHEQDLSTLCPGCAGRISHRSRYCHACGLAIAPQGLANETTEFLCPACGESRRLGSRSLAGGLTVLECSRCAGLWLGNQIFQRLEQQAASRQVSAPVGNSARVAGRADPPVYRPCPECSQLMHRRNYGRQSGVIVDCCARHGIWFDDGELARVLEWVRAGGHRRAAERQIAEARARERGSAPAGGQWVEAPRTRSPLVELARSIIDVLTS